MKNQKLDKNKYNTTDLDPQNSFERHVFHRDQFAHYLRWSHVLKEAKMNKDIVCDFGCGNGNLLEVLYRNKTKPKKYIGIDIRDQSINDLKEKFNAEETLRDNMHYKLDWAEFIVEDLVNPQNGTDFKSINADKVVSFEVLEHVGKQNADIFMENFLACGNDNATFYISTPNYDESVGAARNHTYDSGDGRGVSVQEFSYNELKELFSKHCEIIDSFGTFASQKDYKPYMNEWQKKMFNHIHNYYDSNLVANLMAPFFPEHSRNTLWKLKKKQRTLFNS